MRKLLAIVVVMTLVSVAAVTARAEDSSALEISGNLTTVTAWQRTQSGALRQNPTRGGILGDGLGAHAANGTDTFGFYVD